MIERLLESKGTLHREDIERYVPDPTAEAEIRQARDGYIERLLQPAISNRDP